MLDFLQYKQNFLEATQNWDNQKWNNFNDNPFVLSSPMLEDCHIKNCRLLENREKMLEFLPKNSVVAEVGTQHGRFSARIRNITQPKKLHLIDSNFDLFQSEINQKPRLQAAIENGSVELHEGDSSTILANFPEEYFDWIYIDADHTYEGICKDIDRGYTKVKSDGMMVFNDYTNWSVCEIMPYGVSKAVNEFCIANNWEILYLVLHSLGYHDIAIKKNSGAPEVRIQLQEAKSELESLQFQIQQLVSELDSAKNYLDFIENDKFWKLRSQWIKIKNLFSRSA